MKSKPNQENAQMLSIEVRGNVYTIYTDGICYASNGKDIPQFIFDLRDTFVSATPAGNPL